MAKRWLGATVSSSEIIIVAAEATGSAPMSVLSDETWKLQAGSRPAAYSVIAERIKDFIKDNKIDHVRIKGSAVSMGGTKQAHLEGAELRGVLAASASAAGADVEFVKKAVLSKTFGSRKVDEYLADSSFFSKNLSGAIRAGSREAAFVVMAEADK